ncbi:MAG: GNAT family N-acetyltransferase [Phycisphaerales bacterium]
MNRHNEVGGGSFRDGLERDRAVVRLPIGIGDRGVFERAFSMLGEPISDASFAICFGWGESLELSYVVIEGHLCLMSSVDGDLSMMLPPMCVEEGMEDRLGACIERCFAMMDAENGLCPTRRSRIEYVSDEMLDRIRESSAPVLSASVMPGDYVYKRSAMVELSGGDLKGKRKLRSKFLRENPGWSAAPIGADDLDDCYALLSLWRRESDKRHEGEANELLIGTDVLRERDDRFTRCLLEHLDELGLRSLALRVEGRLVGFTIGEVLVGRGGDEQGVIYVEKTDPAFAGTPQFLFSYFCERCFEGVEEINVGDDWGIESLRYTKTSYRPSRMISKSMLVREPVREGSVVDPGVVRRLEAHPMSEAVLRGAGQVRGETIEVSIRRAVRDDALGIAVVEAFAFGEVDRFTLKQIKRLIANPRAVVLVAQRNGTVVGWVVSLIRTHRRWKSGRIYGVAVDPSMMGRGIGRSLLEETLGVLESMGIGRVYLEVRVDNETAIGLYESLGFVKLANLADYYGEGVPGIRMRRVGGVLSL